jgi:organic radical activating enzyme
MEKNSHQHLVMIKLNYAEFYLTNHCNIACDNCNRFNNHKISGSADWDLHKETYKEWSQILNVDRIALLGGEPLLHPDLPQIINDVCKWWPDTEVEITTNGLLIERLKSLTINTIIANNISLYVSIHKKEWADKIKDSVINKFGGLKLITSSVFPAIDVYQSELGIKVTLEYTYWFRRSALYKNKDKLSLHNSDPEEAHSVCDMRHSFHFWKGFLYKCGVMVTLPYMIEQKSSMLDVSQEQLDLLAEYSPVSIDDARRDPMLVHNLHNSIKQCQFCPSNYNNHEQIFKD